MTNLLICAMCIFHTYACQSHNPENPQTLGGKNFRLDKLTFKENPTLLLGKNRFYKTSIKDNNDRIIAFNCVISKKENAAIKVSLGDIDVSKYKCDFKVSTNNKLIGVSVFFTSPKDQKDMILKNINALYKDYQISINQANTSPSVYHWEAPDKIIHFTYAAFEGDYVYQISIINSKVNCSNFPLEKVFVGEDICLKEYTRKR
ncbi:hypothetical protein [Mucilaginibacter auburnensis]|uniref:Uncharacterized protein n=1 Tax=Mucilaginibacter auburnensis TaxID=1457233 RepID=A0A2H9VUC8_9SPHI|nr:hypothetical protein [Mucilaginibacter auburnensis]PJJ84424.1 hypothetical protein CLV57_1436 [Mucilaginibacter auburnensis]